MEYRNCKHIQNRHCQIFKVSVTSSIERKSVRLVLRRFVKQPVRYLKYRYRTSLNLRKNSKCEHRKLEVGPGGARVPDFETVDIVPSQQVDYLWDVMKKLPFRENCFEVVYASHVLEHLPWYKTKEVLTEWTRILHLGEAWKYGFLTG